jgi:hypothetical protein
MCTSSEQILYVAQSNNNKICSFRLVIKFKVRSNRISFWLCDLWYVQFVYGKWQICRYLLLKQKYHVEKFMCTWIFCFTHFCGLQKFMHIWIFCFTHFCGLQTSMDQVCHECFRKLSLKAKLLDLRGHNNSFSCTI